MHFVGIGGVGMSGIAEVLCTLGYQVSGSDNADNAVTRRLASLGASVQRGHAAANVLGADCVVVSSAIKADNPELMEARAQRIPVVPRAEMLAELMRFQRGIAVAGTHGKTTTTSLLASVLGEGGLDPTFVIGGQLLAAGANARLGGGHWLVAEADESDGSFLRLNPLIAIVTNIDADHLENYGGDFANVQAAFDEFLHRLPFYGLAVLCIDDPEVAALAAQHAAPRDDLRLRRARRRARRGRAPGRRRACASPCACRMARARRSTLALPGRHNVQNALAAAAVGWQLGVDAGRDRARAGEVRRHRPPLQPAGAARAPPRARRCSWSTTTATTRGTGGGVRRRARRLAGQAPGGRVPAAPLQPHARPVRRFRRVLSSVDALVLTEVYPAGEAPIAGADAKSLARAIRARGRIDPVVVGSAGELAAVLPDVLQDGDLLLLMGAGDIGHAAQQLAAHGFRRSRGK